MYIPPYYKGSDSAAAVAFMQRYNFATIVTPNAAGKPIATHLPFVIEQTDTDVVLYSHFAKANAQTEYLLTQPSVVIFQEPHAYIAPAWYESPQNVPTWNYIAVHAYGTITPITDLQGGLAVMERAIMVFDAAYRQQWEQLSDTYKANLLRGTLPFLLQVTELQFKEKLSQNKTPHEQQRISEELAAQADPVSHAIATAMQQQLAKNKSA